jgi:hypothetical protein
MVVLEVGEEVEGVRVEVVVGKVARVIRHLVDITGDIV